MKQIFFPRSKDTGRYSSVRLFSGKWASVGLMGLCLAAAGCATQSQYQNENVPPNTSDSSVNVLLSENEGRVLFESSSIRDRRNIVLTNATEKFGEPQCQASKTGLVNSRKASTIEDCTFDLSPQKLMYAGSPIDNIRYRFLDGRLLQMKVVFERTLSDDSVALRSSLQRDLKLSQANEVLTENEWYLAHDQVTVMQASNELGAQAGSALQISDAKITPLVIGL